ncbi:stonustoxin subunit beta-like [Perca fluviatilis]|uniref:stonustoxin subunit beta-like n=1 Tax=Perca fluviatilis TaxID=8168 RepID=UPI0019624663|nr:stonustoxin subunit beta-like [Perca fluviatilis]
MNYSCKLELDLNTVHSNLKLSDNKKKVTAEEDKSNPNNPETFHYWYQMLCKNKLKGHCYWEVERTGKVNIAVSNINIMRNGDQDDCWFGCNDHSWSLRCCDDEGYAAFHNDKKYPITSSSSVSNRVAVYVDCPAGTLSFYTVSSDSLIHLHTFEMIKFSDPETLCPGFGVWSAGSSVSLCPL